MGGPFPYCFFRAGPGPGLPPFLAGKIVPKKGAAVARTACSPPLPGGAGYVNLRAQDQQVIRCVAVDTTSTCDLLSTDCAPTRLITPTSDKFIAGDTRRHYDAWLRLTNEKFILQTIADATLEFIATPSQLNLPRAIQFADAEFASIDKQISTFLKMGVIEIAYHGQDEFVSNIFTRDKKDGSKRMILNLVKLNQFIRYQHFKMDTIDTVIDLMRANCFMASVDLSNAYFSIPVSKADRRFLRFLWHEQLYQFAVLPNGLSCAPRMFTQVLKPIYGHLREQGHMAAGYIDDSFIMADTYVGCRNSIMYTENLFTSLGFFVNYAKSVLVPTHELEHLGFLLNSTNMTVSLTLPKKLNLIDKCRLMLEDYTHTIRSLAELIGLMVSSFTGVEFGRLHYRQLELDKVNALKFAAGNFDAAVILSQPAKLEIQ